MTSDNATAPILAIHRHRIETDGQGVTSLVGFYGCPLRCGYCLNPISFAPHTPRTEMTAEALYEIARIDELYFLATGGGITFGGGEPLLYADFLVRFRSLCGPAWHLCAETSLAVSWESVALATSVIDVFYVDCKDMSAAIYERYTGKPGTLAHGNLKKLAQLLPPERIVVRLPLIPGYNTESDRENSQRILRSWGLTQLDLFTYKK